MTSSITSVMDPITKGGHENYKKKKKKKKKKKLICMSKQHNDFEKENNVDK